MSIIEKAKQIKMLILDVDGVLTDGGIIIDANGREIKVFNVYDGAGIELAHKAGLLTAIISGRYSAPVEHRAKELRINKVYQNAANKVEVYNKLIAKYGIIPEQTAYIGDDIFDIPLLKLVGLSFAPATGRQEVRDIVDFVTQSAGGKGAVREAIEVILKAQGQWQQT
ncbi:HAD hydrolase family protein [bacterium]|nr:HAD hydrolase family protein [bacterium]MBU1754402.1 HAD hydrolase family protein [bacterium]